VNHRSLNLFYKDGEVGQPVLLSVRHASCRDLEMCFVHSSTFLKKIE